jgi:hypothetical protein
MVEKAMEKIRTEMEQNKGNGYIQFVGQALLDRLRDIPNNAAAILTEGKTIAKSLDAMAAEAKKKPRFGNCAMITPDEGMKVVLGYFGIDQPVQIPAGDTAKNDNDFNLKLEDLL